MSNVSVTETVYNITVTETDSAVTVTSGDTINVTVNSFIISTGVINAGSGAAVGKGIVGDNLHLRTISSGDDIVVTENTDDITIALAASIDANLTGDTTGTHFGPVTGDVTGDLTGDVTGNITSTNSTINVINDVAEINNTNNITITPVSTGYLHANVGNVYVGTLTQAAHITGTEIKSVGTTLEITGNLTGDVTGDVTGTVSDISNHTTTDLTEGTNLYYTQARFDSAFAAKDTGDLTEGTNLYWTQTRFDNAIANITTDDVPEGSNLYYTDARVNAAIGDLTVDIIPSISSGVDLGDATTYFGRAYAEQIYTVDLIPKEQQRIRSYGHFHPAGNKTYDLGSPTLQWRSAYIGPGSLYIDGQKVMGSDETGAIDITTDAGQNLNISSGNDIQFLTQGNATGTQAFTVKLDDIDLGDPALSSATVNVNGLLEAPDLHIGDLELDATLINQTATNQNLEIRTNGTGYLHANVADFYVGPLTGAVKIDENSISTTSGTLTVTGNLIGDVTGTVSDVSNHDTDDISEGTTNLYYTDARARSAISLTSTNTAELSYDNSTGVFSYVSPTTVTASNAVTLQVRNASGVDISKGDAVYISGHSGNKVLIAKADNDATGLYPAIGLAAGAMANNTDGEVTVYGELAGVDTSSYSVGDVLYLSSTPGELTNTRPTGSANAVQNIGKVARADSNGIIIISGSGRANDVPNLSSGEVFIGNGSGYEKRALDTDDVAEATNLYYTDARADARIGAASVFDLSDVTNIGGLTDLHVLGYSTAASSFVNVLPTTDIVSEGSTNLYYTDARARASISASGSLSYDSNTGVISYTQPTNVSAFTNDAGYLTSYTETDPIYTASSWYSTTNNSANWNTAYSWGDHSSAGYVNSAGAISAVEGEATLDLTGDVTIANDLDVSGLVKIDDGFTLGTFNPYSAYGGTTMNTNLSGVGKQSGWAGMSVRSRGEHDYGLSGFGIPPEAPRALNLLQAGRLSGSSDDYLNNGDKFAQVMMAPYSAYRTGLEWLTPSALIEGIATEDHSTSGMGTKMRLWTTENGDLAGATDVQHAKDYIEIQGTTIRTNDTLKLDDDVQITGDITGNGSGIVNVADTTRVTGNASTKTTTIGDDTVSGGLYDVHGFTVRAGDTAWSSVTLDEHIGGVDKPINAFSNPVILGQVWGGTPSSQEAVTSGKRLITIAGQGSYDNGGTIEQPSSAPVRIVGQTTENQTSTARGAQLTIETTPNGSNGKISTKFQGNEVIINTTGDGKIYTGGDLTLDDDVTITGTLDVDNATTLSGNVALGTYGGTTHVTLPGGAGHTLPTSTSDTAGGQSFEIRAGADGSGVHLFLYVPGVGWMRTTLSTF